MHALWRCACLALVAHSVVLDTTQQGVVFSQQVLMQEVLHTIMEQASTLHGQVLPVQQGRVVLVVAVIVVADDVVGQALQRLDLLPGQQAGLISCGVTKKEGMPRLATMASRDCRAMRW